MNLKKRDACIIWNTKLREVNETTAFSQEEYEINSPRAGGRYRISNSIYKQFMNMDNSARSKIFNKREKLVLSGWIAKENLKNNIPSFDLMVRDNRRESDDYFLNRLPPVPIPDVNPGKRAYLLLEGLVKRTNVIGGTFSYDYFLSWSHKGQLTHQYTFFYALSYCNQNDEMQYLLNYLEEMEFIKVTQRSDGCSDFEVTVKGFEKINTISNMDSSTAFIAMWFDPSMNGLKEEIKKGVRQAGYEPLRIDEKEYNNKIDDEILFDIDQSRFVICDLTSEPGKPRGNVYFEAGYAKKAKGNEFIIWTCNEQLRSEVAFDVGGYNFIFWYRDEQGNFWTWDGNEKILLKDKIQKRIESVLYKYKKPEKGVQRYEENRV